MTDTTDEATADATILKAKDGWRTTEFWIALVMTAIGAWLIAKGKEEIGGVLVAMAGSGYTAGRTVVKRAVRVSLVLLALCLSGCHASCLTPVNVGPAMTDALNRHDTYVSEDGALTPTQREVYLTTSLMIRDVLHEAGYPPEEATHGPPEAEETE